MESRVVRAKERGRIPGLKASFVVGGQEVSQQESSGVVGRGRCGVGEMSARGDRSVDFCGCH